jgi:hypothetical protein
VQLNRISGGRGAKTNQHTDGGRFHTSSSSSADARDLTSTQRHCARKAFSSLDNFSGFFNLGVPFVAIKYNAFNGSSSATVSHTNQRRSVNLGGGTKIRWLLLNHLNCHDSQRPYIDLCAILLLLDDLGGHPIRCSDHRRPLILLFGEFGAEAKVCYFDGAGGGEQNVIRFYVAVDNVLAV